MLCLLHSSLRAGPGQPQRCWSSGSRTLPGTHGRSDNTFPVPSPAANNPGKALLQGVPTESPLPGPSKQWRAMEEKNSLNWCIPDRGHSCCCLPSSFHPSLSAGQARTRIEQPTASARLAGADTAKPGLGRWLPRVGPSWGRAWGGGQDSWVSRFTQLCLTVWGATGRARPLPRLCNL